MNSKEYVDTLSITECACVAAGLRNRKANGDELSNEEQKILRLSHERTGRWLRERGKLVGKREH